MTSAETTQMLSQAVTEIQELRTALETSSGRTDNDPIAIVGMACRFPGASDPEAFWELLCAGRDAITDIPGDRFNVKDFYHPDRDTPGKMYTKRGAFLDDIDKFDAPFFGVSPREAAQMDPQQRLFLEVAWEALENGGQPLGRLSGTKTGVFMGVTAFDYSLRVMQQSQPPDLEAYCLTGGLAGTFTPGRLSYWLGLQGPSLSVDTACSSSLVAVHQAVQSLRAGDCTMALAGGVNVLLSPEWFIVLSRANMLAADGRCKTFDRNADGYVRGEGCGVVVLKRLSDALAGNDRVLAVIRGSAVNQDGRSSGITVPNGSAQRAVIREALHKAGVVGSDIGYVEAHGTGTPLGDPIEVNALCDVLGPGREPGERFAIGSVKTNIGHLEPAAGVAGLIKAVLMLRNGQIPPLLHLTEVNPDIPVDELPITIPTTLAPWPHGQRPRLAGVSSFGASGTNAHVVLEEAPVTERPPASADRTAHLVCLSARSGEALTGLARHYAHQLSTNPAESLADIGFTANTGRAHFGHRLAVVADTVEQLRERLASHGAGESDSDVHTGARASGSRPKAAFLFTGQGSQYAGMGRELFDTQPSFRQDLEHCDELLREHLDRPLLSLIFPEDGNTSLINETRYTQPALFCIQYALARLWRSWGIQPAAMLGHSVGEYAAACVAGVFALEDGLALIAERARLMHELPAGGGMTALLTDRDRVAEALLPYEDVLSIAAINGPTNTVISGAREALEKVAGRFAEQGVKVIPLRVSHAFHSPLIEPMLDDFERTAAPLRFAAPRIPLVCNLTGELAKKTTFTARYLVDHARAPVQFTAGLLRLVEQGCSAFVEIGPAPILCEMAKHTVTDETSAWLPSLRKGHGDWTTILGSLGELQVKGFDVDWEGFDQGYPRRRVGLPTYPFQRKRHWFQVSPPRSATTVRTTTGSETPPVETGTAPTVLGRCVPSPLDIVQFHNTLTVDAHPGLGENVLDGYSVVNAGFYLEAALEAATALHETDQVVISNLVIPQALVMPAQGGQVTQLVAEPADDSPTEFRYYGRISAEGSWALHAKGTFSAAVDTRPALDSAEINAIRSRCPNDLPGYHFYRGLWQRRIQLGHSARWLDRISYGPGEAIAWLRAPEDDEAGNYRLDPGIVDSALQLLFACIAGNVSPDTVILLVELEEYRFYVHEGEELLCHARLRDNPIESDLLTADIQLMTGQGKAVARMNGVHVRRSSRDAVLQAIRTAPKPTTAKVRGTTAASTQRLRPARRKESATEGVAPLREVLIEQAARVLGTSGQDIDTNEPLQDLGLDSLMAVELRDAVTKELGLSLPAATFLGNPSIAQLESILLPKLESQHALATRPARAADLTPIEHIGPGGMHVTELGDGPPVVFVHGGVFGGMDAWQTQVPLAQRWRLIIPSRLNYGESATSEREDFADDATLIAELLGDGAHVVAQSYGTVVAMLAAAARPDAVLSLTLIESAASSVARGTPAVDDYEHGMKRLIASPPGNPEEFLRNAFAFIEPTARFPSPLSPTLLAFAKRMHAIRWPWEADIPAEALRDAPFPTLVVTGGERPVFEAIGDALADQLGGQRLVIPGGHGTQNVGAAFNEALENFLNHACPAAAEEAAG